MKRIPFAPGDVGGKPAMQKKMFGQRVRRLLSKKRGLCLILCCAAMYVMKAINEQKMNSPDPEVPNSSGVSDLVHNTITVVSKPIVRLVLRIDRRLVIFALYNGQSVTKNLLGIAV